jgi:hypothetical protein
LSLDEEGATGIHHARIVTRKEGGRDHHLPAPAPASAPPPPTPSLPFRRAYVHGRTNDPGFGALRLVLMQPAWASSRRGKQMRQAEEAASVGRESGGRVSSAGRSAAWLHK